MVPRTNRIVWFFAFGYFVCYAFYSALVKQVTDGAQVPGLSLLPAVTLGTAITLPLLVASLGWWRVAPRFDADTIIAGLATGVIIVTTTLAYTFDGVSIVFALLLLRGGVLILAPVVDTLTGRGVRWFCWAALLASMSGLFIALANAGDTRMTFVAVLNTSAYLAAYAVRLPRMTKSAKVSDPELTRRWFLGEMIIALAVQLLLPLLAALTPAGAAIRGGIVSLRPAGLLVGVMYGFLYFFGTSVYLDRRENTFCVPLNRGASLLAGIVATIAIGGTLRASDLAGASLVIGALLFLSPVHHLPETFFARIARAARNKELLP
ncbi:MAG TPA: hypothetical protein VHW00_06240 [Thermoanaerobaculia bacterium]|nr:hypothetical protein [Thermoanaerobaculia bacterium]